MATLSEASLTTGGLDEDSHATGVSALDSSGRMGEDIGHLTASRATDIVEAGVRGLRKRKKEKGET